METMTDSHQDSVLFAEPTPPETSTPPVETTDAGGNAPAAEPDTKPDIAPDTKPGEGDAKPDDAKPDADTKVDTTNDTPEYVKASDYERVVAELEALKTGNTGDPIADTALVAKKPEIDLTTIDPSLLFDPADIPDDVFDAMGIEPIHEDGAPLRASVAKQFSAVAHKASEVAYQRAKAEFYQNMVNEVARISTVLDLGRDVAKEILKGRPELGEPKEFLKLSTAISQAASKSAPGTTTEALAAESYRLYSEAGGIVERFKEQGGKIIKNNGAGNGTAPQQRVGTAPPQAKPSPMTPPEEARKSVLFG